MGAMLLAHVSQANAENYGIDIHGEAVVDGGHTFISSSTLRMVAA